MKKHESSQSDARHISLGTGLSRRLREGTIATSHSQGRDFFKERVARHREKKAEAGNKTSQEPVTS